MSPDPVRVTPEQVTSLLEKVFPQITGRYTIERLDLHHCTLVYHMGQENLRPGGTISGPSLFGAADLAFYLATMTYIGADAMAVTANANIHFLRKPRPGDVRAVARVLKPGRGLSVGDVLLYSVGEEQPVAQASLSYAIPRP